MIHEYTRTHVSGTRASHRRSLCRTGLLFALVAVHGVSAAVGAEPRAARSQSTAGAAAQTKQAYTLSVTSKEGFVDVALKADDAKLSEIAADLSKRLGARVVLGPTLAKETISVSVPESALEPALSALAPRVFVDYEIRQDARPVPQDIYLLGLTDPEPSSKPDARGMSQGLLITGHTEDTTKPSADDPLKVIGDKHLLTITSKKQPLAVVAMAIADVLGVPVDLKHESTELVDMDIRDAPPEDVIPRLSPNVRLYVRVDVNRSERTLLRLVVAPPAAK